MSKMTEENLKAAFAGESQASMKYKLFAEIAKKRGLTNVAKLFEATSYAEQVHAKNHLKALKGLRGTSDNLEVAIGGEDFEVDEMYPAYLAVAKLQEQKSAIRSFNWAIEAEKVHSKLYSEAKEAVDNDSDAELGKIYVCPVCGWTHHGEEHDDNCPLCGLEWDKFIAF